MNIFKELKADLQNNCKSICNDQEIWNQATLEAPKDPLNGDIATNIAMIIAAKKGGNPREIALEFKDCLSKIPYIAHIEVAGPGFINFTIKAEKWHQCIKSILNDDKDFWQINVGNNQKVNIEYVSANPTGPLHIGHARGAVYGDALANILQKCGYDITKEYYVNDAGSQIDTLTESVILRYKEALDDKKAVIPEGFYPGEYLQVVGKNIARQHGDALLKADKQEMYQTIRKFAINSMLDLIREDLEQLGIKHDIFFSEQSLHDGGKIDEAVSILEKTGLIYEGTLPPPKGKIDENWQKKKQTLFRSSKYGDDQDRPIKKNDGSWSYLAADFAYAKDKIDRGFNLLVYILGSDHNGYIKRIEAVVDALSNGKVQSDVRTTQLVNFVKNKEPIKMSKRSGNFMTVRDVIDEVGKDIVRFMMLTRRNDLALDFDFDQVKEQSKDNPVFYVQYAYVRSKSILSKAKESMVEAYAKFEAAEFDLSLLSTEEEIQLIKLLASWPKILASAAKSREPHKISYYLIDIASRFHSIWNLGKTDREYRFNAEDNPELTTARLALAESIRKVIAGGFELIGVTPMNRM